MLTPFEQLPTELILLILYFKKNPKYFGLISRLNKNIFKKFQVNNDKVELYWSKLYQDHYIRPIEVLDEILIKHKKKHRVQKSYRELYEKKFLGDKKQNNKRTEKQQLLYNWTRFGDLQAIQQEIWNPEDLLEKSYEFLNYGLPHPKKTPLFLASKYKRQNILTYCFTEIFNKANTTGNLTKIVWAAACNLPTEIDKLIQQETIDPQLLTDFLNSNVLRCALVFGNYEAVFALLDIKRINKVVADGFRPLTIASIFGHLDIVQFLLRAKAEPHIQSLSVAAYYGRKSIVQTLLKEEEVDVNEVDIERKTPLLRAIYKGHYDIVQVLLEAGAKVDLASKFKTAYETSPLSVAKKKKSPEIYTLLKLWKVKTETSHLPLLKRIICLLETNLETNTQNTIIPEFLTKFAEKISVMTFFQNDSLNKLIIDLKKITIKDEADEKRIIEMIKQRSNVVPNEKMEFLSQYIFQNSSAQDKKEISLSKDR